MLSSVIVTREMLVADKACYPAIEAFDLSFPGGSATLQQIADHQLCEPEWLGWLAVNASFVTEDIAMELIQRSDDPGHYYGAAAERAHWVTSETGPAMIEKSSDPRYFSMFAIRYAKWMTPKIKAELVAKYRL